jgi:hypothetical protein
MKLKPLTVGGYLFIPLCIGGDHYLPSQFWLIALGVGFFMSIVLYIGLIVFLLKLKKLLPELTDGIPSDVRATFHGRSFEFAYATTATYWMTSVVYLNAVEAYWPLALCVICIPLAIYAISLGRSMVGGLKETL